MHVLSLPLAFILSQDQTLHCKNCLFFTFRAPYPAPFDSSSCPPPRLRAAADTRYLSLLIRFNVLSLPHHRVFNNPVFRRKRMQRYNLFRNRQNIFLPFSSQSGATGCRSAPWAMKKIFGQPPERPPTACTQAAFGGGNSKNQPTDRPRRGISATSRCCTMVYAAKTGLQARRKGRGTAPTAHGAGQKRTETQHADTQAATTAKAAQPNDTQNIRGRL